MILWKDHAEKYCPRTHGHEKHGPGEDGYGIYGPGADGEQYGPGKTKAHEWWLWKRSSLEHMVQKRMVPEIMDIQNMLSWNRFSWKNIALEKTAMKKNGPMRDGLMKDDEKSDGFWNAMVTKKEISKKDGPNIITDRFSCRCKPDIIGRKVDKLEKIDRPPHSSNSSSQSQLQEPWWAVI